MSATPRKSSRPDEYACYTNPVDVSDETLNSYQKPLTDILVLDNGMKDLKELEFNNGKISLFFYVIITRPSF